MEFNGYTHDIKYIRSFIESQATCYVVKKDAKVLIAANFMDEDMLFMGAEIETIGCFVIIIDDKYCLFKQTCTVKIEPTVVNQIKIDDVLYYELILEKGSKLIASKNVVKMDKNPYNIYQSFITKGHPPEYLDYDNKLTIFKYAKKYSGLRLGASSKVAEMLISTTCRAPNDLTKMYRQVATLDYKGKHVNIPFNNVIYGASNTTARLAGSYAEMGAIGALINPSVRMETIESILR